MCPVPVKCKMNLFYNTFNVTCSGKFSPVTHSLKWHIGLYQETNTSHMTTTTWFCQGWETNGESHVKLSVSFYTGQAKVMPITFTWLSFGLIK